LPAEGDCCFLILMISVYVLGLGICVNKCFIGCLGWSTGESKSSFSALKDGLGMDEYRNTFRDWIRHL